MINFLTKASFIVIFLYLVYCLLISSPQLQKEVLFLHRFNFPNPAKLQDPSVFGFPENQARNFYLETKQNRKLGVWQVIPSDSYWDQLENKSGNFDTSFYTSFFTNKSSHTMIYLHGNAGNRATFHRPFTYQKLSSFNQVNIVAFDYAGFGDSKGYPSEDSVVEDSKAVWDWCIEQGASPDRITIFGHSLGTAIATKLVQELQDLGTLPKSLILKAPLSSVRKAVFDFKLMARFPVLGPLKDVQQFRNYVDKVIKLKFDSLSIIKNLKVPILILHGYEDKVLPISHGEALHDIAVSSPHCHTTNITQGVPDKVDLLESRCSDSRSIQLAKFAHIGHDDFHRFDSCFFIIKRFLEGL